MNRKPEDYGKGYSREEVAAHYAALIDEPGALPLEQMLEELKGTEFDEHAYAYCKAESTLTAGQLMRVRSASATAADLRRDLLGLQASPLCDSDSAEVEGALELLGMISDRLAVLGK